MEEKLAKDIYAALLKAGEKAILIDVRNPEEYQEGHAKGAVNIPLADLMSRIDELKKYSEVYTICHAGVRSASAGHFLESQGKWNVVASVVHGTMAWEENGLPMER